MKQIEFTCIMCPVGCHLTASINKGEVTITGNRCPRGEVFGKSEAVNPTRMVTSVMIGNNAIYSVKTANPVPKCKIFDCLAEIKQAKPPKNAKLGQIVIKNVAKTGENVIITGINRQ